MTGQTLFLTVGPIGLTILLALYIGIGVRHVWIGIHMQDVTGPLVNRLDKHTFFLINLVLLWIVGIFLFWVFMMDPEYWVFGLRYVGVATVVIIGIYLLDSLVLLTKDLFTSKNIGFESVLGESLSMRQQQYFFLAVGIALIIDPLGILAVHFSILSR